MSAPTNLTPTCREHSRARVRRRFIVSPGILHPFPFLPGDSLQDWRQDVRSRGHLRLVEPPRERIDWFNLAVYSVIGVYMVAASYFLVWLGCWVFAGLS